MAVDERVENLDRQDSEEGRAGGTSLMGSRVEFHATRRQDRARLSGCKLRSPNAHRVIVMFEEWWGLDDRIKTTADRLASHGFNVLVPDLFAGAVAARATKQTI